MAVEHDLESFVDESIDVSRKNGYNPTTFISMRIRHTTKGAIARLVVNGTIQSGFERMAQLGLLDWTLEQAVLNFPSEFPREVREAAEWRLSQARQQTSSKP